MMFAVWAERELILHGCSVWCSLISPKVVRYHYYVELSPEYCLGGNRGPRTVRVVSVSDGLGTHQLQVLKYCKTRVQNKSDISTVANGEWGMDELSKSLADNLVGGVLRIARLGAVLDKSKDQKTKMPLGITRVGN
jgi:hypothetical protein